MLLVSVQIPALVATSPFSHSHTAIGCVAQDSAYVGCWDSDMGSTELFDESIPHVCLSPMHYALNHAGGAHRACIYGDGRP